MAGYQIKFTDFINKGSITIEDQSFNSETSLTFPGKNVTAYAQTIGENFLHLLENFAKNTEPTNPVEGQLWYDNTEGVNQLKVYDGTTWTAAGNVKKASSTPDVANSVIGDLWVDTDNQQLYLFNGSNWLLVGPQFSEGLRTGIQSDTITDTNNVSHNIVSFYADDELVSIISKDAFTPKLTIDGFSTISQGINLSTKNFNSNSNLNRFWGTASAADALRVGSNNISSSNFLRSDTTSTTNFGLNIRNNAGLSIGNDLATSITNDSGTAVIYHKTSGSAIDLRVNNAGTISTAIRVDSSTNVGINKSNPEESLDVAGVIKTDNSLVVTGTANATDLVTGSIRTAGGASITKSLQVGQGVTVAGVSSFQNVLPQTDSTYTLGSDPLSGGKAWNRVYADTVYATEFVGAFTGNLSGSVSGSATRLASPTVFQLSGDVSSNSVSFNGVTSTGLLTLTTTIDQTFISSKTELDDSEPSDELLIYRPASGIRKATRSTFLSSVPLVPAGSVFAYAGSTVPGGYLLCDGREVKIVDYPELFDAIGYSYKDISLLIGLSTFALPDLRGRFALGRDDMNNGSSGYPLSGNSTIQSIVDPSTQISGGGGSANRVTDAGADTIGGGLGTSEQAIGVENLPEHTHDLKGNAGNQYYAIRNVTGVPDDTDAVTHTTNGPDAPGTGQYLANSGGILTGGSLNVPLDILNPCLTLNYIIFTGRIA